MKVKGNILKAREVFVTERFGEGAWAKVIAELSSEDRQVLGGTILNIGWYDFGLATRLDDAIVGILGGGNTRLFEDMGRASATENLSGVHADLLTPGDPQSFMGKAQTIYRFYYDIGSRTYEETGPNQGVLTTHDAETFSVADCATVVGWYTQALEMCGATGVRVEEVECRARGDEVCRYSVKWS